MWQMLPQSGRDIISCMSIIAMLTFLVVVSAIISGVHLVTYKALVSIFAITNPQTLLVFKIVFIILGLSFITASLLSSRYNTIFTKLFYTFSATWMGFLTYLFLMACLYFAVSLIGTALGTTVIAHLPLIGKVLMAIAVVTSLYGLYSAQNIVVRPLTIKIENLPESWQGRRAVFISDVHLGQVRTEKFAEKVVSTIQGLNPEIIFNTGDLYDGVAVDKDKVVAPFKKLSAPLGSYFVMGNHEEFKEALYYNNSITDAGMHILDNEVAVVDGVQIVGVDYLATTQAEPFKNVISNIPLDKNRPAILLKHVPLHLDVAENAGMSLQLSGHTHKAQLFPLNIITKIIYKGYDYGLKPFGSMQVLTTSGVGTWGPPLRVGSSAEIFLLTFE